MPADSRLALISPQLPPAHDAIGEYTAELAVALSAQSRVTVLTSRADSVQELPNVAISQCFSLEGANRFKGLSAALAVADATACVFQYNPFAWGRRGWAPDLVSLVRNLRTRRPDMTVAVMFHETYMMNQGIKAWIMRQYQWHQYDALLRLADVSFFSIQAWMRQEQVRGVARRVVHLPVGSNLPKSHAGRLETRARWQIRSDSFVCGIFGGLHVTRRLAWVGRLMNRLARLSRRHVSLLCIGGQSDGVLKELNLLPEPNLTVICTGRLPPLEAADAIAACHLMLSPFSDGISSRRGSAIGALQQGVPLASTDGDLTDCFWRGRQNAGIHLAPADDETAWSNMVVDVALNQSFTAESKAQLHAFFDRHFSWNSISIALRAALAGIPCDAETNAQEPREAPLDPIRAAVLH
jgi:glycosyltransferase involved in cell wall biosynthesis